MRLAGAGDRVAAQRAGVERQPDLRERSRDLVEPVVGHVRQHEVLLACDPDVAAGVSARSASAIIWSPRHEPEVDRHADVAAPVALSCTPR